MSMSALAMGGAGPAVRPPRCAVLALALALVSAGCVPVGGDVYDDVALFDKPWAYWRLVPARGNATAVIADSSQRSTLPGGRFPGVFENDYSVGTTRVRCRRVPCVWWQDAMLRTDAQNSRRHPATHPPPSGQTGEEEEAGGGGGAAADMGSANFNAGGRIAVPEFFIPPATALTVELFFAPACNTTEGSATQSLFRLLTESTVFTPRILVERGDVTAYLALNSAVSNTSYLAVLRQLRVSPQGGGWTAETWHHVALTFNGSASILYVDGEQSAAWHEDASKQVGDSCQRTQKSDGRCERGSGVVLGEGFNGHLQRAAVYTYALAPSRIRAHYNAFFDSDDGVGRGQQRGQGRTGEQWPRGRMATAEGAGGLPVTGGRFSECRLPFEERDMGMGPGVVPAIMSFIVVAIGLSALLVSVILHLVWSNLAHGGGDLMQGIMSTRAAIPEHSVVLDNPPQYPSVVLGVLGLLLPLAYLSQWYGEVDARTRDDREAYVLHYVLWLACECGGTLLLLAMSNLHDPQGTCAIGLLCISALTVLLGAAADLGGGVEGATKTSLCPRPVQGPAPLDLGAAGWADGSGGGGDGVWGWGCLPPVGWYCPLTAVAVLSLVPIYVLTSRPVAVSARRGRGVEMCWSESALAGVGDGGAEADDEDDEAPLLRRGQVERVRQEAQAWGEREAASVRRWGCVGYLLQLGRVGVQIVCGEDTAEVEGYPEESSVRERASHLRTTSLLRLWFFTSMTLRRVGWMLAVGLRGSHLTDDERLVTMGSIDCLSVIGLAAILWSSEATDWPSVMQRRRARVGLPPPSSNPSDSDCEESLHRVSDVSNHSESCRSLPRVDWGDTRDAARSRCAPASAVLSLEAATEHDLEQVGRLSGAGVGAGIGARGSRSESEISNAAPCASEDSMVTPWTASSAGGWQDSLLFRELRELGYMVWRDPLRHTLQAASDQDFVAAQRWGAIATVSTLISLAAFLVVKTATPVLDLDCWTSASALLDALNASSAAPTHARAARTSALSKSLLPRHWRGRRHTVNVDGRSRSVWGGWFSGGASEGWSNDVADFPLLQCKTGCSARRSLLPPVFGSEYSEAAFAHGHVLWGWNDVYGGGGAAPGGDGMKWGRHRAPVDPASVYADTSSHSGSLYADKSALCRSAVHAGLLQGDEAEEDGVRPGGWWEWLNYISAFRGVQGGCFSIKLLDPLSVYTGGVRNGVESLSLNLSSTARSSSQSGGRVRGARDAAVKAAFSYQIVAPYAPCPADLGAYAMLIVILLCGALVAACLPLPLLWLALLCVMYLLQVVLEALPVSGTTGAQLLGQELFGHVGGTLWWAGGRPASDFLKALLFAAVSPFVYLIGPAWVLRAPPWQWHIPFPAAQKNWLSRLPVPARNSRELMTRNFLCFTLPMLLGCSLSPFLPFLRSVCLSASLWFQVFRGPASASEQVVWSERGVGEGGWGLATLLSEGSAVGMLVAVLLFQCLRGSYRSGELMRLGSVYLVLVSMMFAVTFLVQTHYQLVLPGYFFYVFLVPCTAQDKHAAAILQGLLLGMTVRDLTVHGPVSVWEYQSTSNF